MISQFARKQVGAAYHHERFLHTKDGVTCEIGIPLWVQRRRQFAKSGSVDHHMQVIRTKVVSPDCQKEVAHWALIVTTE